MSDRPEISWFSALCDDDYEYLGVPDPALASSWDHCREIVVAADRHGFDNMLLPSGYDLGIDNTAFAAAVAPLTEQIKLLLAIRMGELVAPQVVRQVATLQQIAGGRLDVNIISSDVPGQTMESEPRYRRSTELMYVIRELLDGRAVELRRTDKPVSSLKTGGDPSRSALFAAWEEQGESWAAYSRNGGGAWSLSHVPVQAARVPL